MNAIVEKAPAKINLTLDVLHKRDDGYHEVEMIMTTIDLADRIILTPLPTSAIKVECTASFIPVDSRNLVYQAAKLLQDRFNIAKGIKITIEKRIPVAAGLAGGSSDAAAALRGLNRLWELNLSLDELAELGSLIGSDVSFCVYGGTALAKGRGEIIEKLQPLPRFWVVLAKPPIGVSTGNIYTKLNLNQIEHRPNTAAMLQAIEEQSFKGICANLGNVLESVTLAEHPEVERLKQRMERCGAEGVLMSGSGPTVYAITQKESRMQRVYNALKGFCKEVYVVRSIG